MPSPKRRIQIVAALIVAGIVALLYSIVVTQELLLGVSIALSLLLCSYIMEVLTARHSPVSQSVSQSSMALSHFNFLSPSSPPALSISPHG